MAYKRKENQLLQPNSLRDKIYLDRRPYTQWYREFVHMQPQKYTPNSFISSWQGISGYDLAEEDSQYDESVQEIWTVIL